MERRAGFTPFHRESISSPGSGEHFRSRIGRAFPIQDANSIKMWLAGDLSCKQEDETGGDPGSEVQPLVLQASAFSNPFIKMDLHERGFYFYK